MKKREGKKLTLSRETVRHLTNEDLDMVAGGRYTQTRTAATCPGAGCPNSWVTESCFCEC